MLLTLCHQEAAADLEALKLSYQADKAAWAAKEQHLAGVIDPAPASWTSLVAIHRLACLRYASGTRKRL